MSPHALETVMSPLIEQIRETISPVLRRYGVTKAGIFGSAVTGQVHEGSDIDIAVQIDTDISLLDFVGLKLELEDTLGRKVDLVEYDAIKPRLRESILRHQEMIL
jgi:predicted nucleotidyltransferase